MYYCSYMFIDPLNFLQSIQYIGNKVTRNTLTSWVPYYDLDFCRGHLLIGANFFNLVKLLHIRS